jgi:1-acyl-sn-glycerol-3-phosphate acyltransferase
VSIDPVEQRVGAVLAEVLGGAPEPGERVDADSLSQAELVMALEDAFGIQLSDDTSFGSTGEAVQAVRHALERRRPSVPPLGEGFGRLHVFGASVTGSLLRPYYRPRIFGQEHVPPSGPAVLAMNHDSLLDIPFLVLASPRPVWFMAKEELFRGRFASWFFHVLGGFPVRRGGYDLGAVRAALEVIRRGLLLGMYPEGTRTPHLLEFLPGAAWMALATGVPLVPAAIKGTAESLPRGSKVPRRTRVTVRFGEALHPGKEDDPRARLERARKVTQDLRAEVERLLSR